MKSFDEVKKGDIVKSLNDGMVCEIVMYRGEKYLSGFHDMWNVNQFDPNDWVKIDSKNKFCVEKNEILKESCEDEWKLISCFQTYDEALSQIGYEKSHDDLWNEHNLYRIVVKE